MIKIIVLIVFLAGCSGETYESNVDQRLYRECMKSTPPAAFDNVGGTHMVIDACERASKPLSSCPQR
jgi:PBP1b-binding outer membrane lipoprotein LpoB